MSMEYVVYVKSNENGYITAVDSSEFLNDIIGWTEIDRGYGDKYHHAQSYYFEKPILTDGGIYQYRLSENDKPVECTPEDIAKQEKANQPVPTAPRNITEGEYITIGGVLYKAIANIPKGEPIITGQNAIETTVEEQLAELAKGE